MDTSILIHIAGNCCRLILRNWLYRFFILFACIGIFVVQLFLQGDITDYNISGLITMPSFVPYMNIYMYTILQAFIVIFLVGSFFDKERKLDTIDTVYYRPESNRELLLGYFLGFILCFLLGAVVSLFLGISIHLFCSAAPFSLFSYIFYLLTFLLPSMIFYTGISFFVFVVMKRQIFGCIILLFFLFLNFRYLGDFAGGLMDFLGISLPNALSCVVGHPDLYPYLAQRICWFLVGCFFLGVSMEVFSRKPNEHKKMTGVLLLILVTAMGCGFYCYKNNRDRYTVRTTYREIYARYKRDHYLSLEKEDIKFHHDGTTISCESVLTVFNSTGLEQNDFLFYLNPALIIHSIKVENQSLPFTREEQVVKVKRKVAPGERLILEVVYSGHIDDRVCHLDVTDDVYGDTRTSRYLTCRFGKRAVFLGKDYTLLTPESLWYPVMSPPVNPRLPLDVQRQFASFRLTVSGCGTKQVISQGNKKEYKDRVDFETDHPVMGLSLCIGDYIRKAVVVDDVSYELYVYKSSWDIFKGIRHIDKYLSEMIREIRNKAEEQMGRGYPYSYFRLVETPLSFGSYYRMHTGGSDRVQPEMFFAPERGIDFWLDVKQEKKGKQTKRKTVSSVITLGGMIDGTDEERERAIVSGLLHVSFLWKYHWENSAYYTYKEFNPFTLNWEEKSGKSLSPRWNHYYLSSMFYEQLYQIKSLEFPVIDHVFSEIVKAERGAEKLHARKGYLEAEAVNYLRKYSLAEAVKDPALTEEVLGMILALKTDELFRVCASHEIQPKELYAFIDSCILGSSFQEINFDELSTRFRELYMVDWRPIFMEWYHQNTIPTYIIKKFQVQRVKTSRGTEEINSKNVTKIGEMKSIEQHGIKLRVDFEIYNDSKVDGVISLVKKKNEDLFSTAHYTSDKLLYKNFTIKAGKGIILSLLYDDFIPYLDLGISENKPRVITNDFQYHETEEFEECTRYADKSYFIQQGDSLEIIVDNEDIGFQKPGRKSFWIRNLLRGEKTNKQKYDYKLVADDEWKTYIADKNYGTPVRSAVFKLAGEGKKTIMWEANIILNGEYEIFTYIPSVEDIISLKYMDRTISGMFTNRKKQYYMVKSNIDMHQVEIDITRKNGQWVLLGKYYLEKGEARVELSDKGNDIDQVILGDAVKFVYTGK